VWFDVLIHVGGAPEGRLTMSKLSTDISLTTGGVTRLVDRMVEADLVARSNCPSDRRSVHVILTDKGQAKLSEAITEHIEGIDRHLMTPLTSADRGALKVSLAKLVNGSC
jgi:DNA-binding MarR family transcriptional regulator